MELRDFFYEHPRIALAFSGGADSAYLLYAAKSLGAEVTAYYVKSCFQPEFELRDAQQLAEQLSADMKILNVDILADAVVRANPTNRCYFCKQRIFSAICTAAARDGFTEIMDGTNASDDSGDRPGMRALRELGVFSPLRDCGITKARLRELSKAAGLFTWDKPAYACLATRLPAGLEISEEALRHIENAESALDSLGLRDFRVRTDGHTAKLQVKEAQLLFVMENRLRIIDLLKDDFSDMVLDLKTR